MLYVAESTSASGGGENSLLDLCEAIAKGPHQLQPILAGPMGAMAIAAAERGIPWYAIGEARWTLQRPTPRRVGQLLSIAIGMTRVILRVRPVIVHANSLEAAVCAWPGTALARKPFVVHWRGVGALRSGTRRLLRVLCDRAQLVVAPTVAVRDHLVEVGVDVKRIAVVANPVRAVSEGFLTPSGAGAPIPSSLSGLERGARIVLAVGRAVPAKGLDNVIRCFAALQDFRKGSTVLVIVVSAGARQEKAYFSTLRALAEELGVLSDTVFVSAPVDICGFLKRADVVWNLARDEAFGRIVVEALAAGLPVVATRVGGVPEILGRDWPYLVSEGEWEAAAQLTAKLLWGPNGGIELPSVDLDRFRPEVVAALLLEKYSGIVGDPGLFELPRRGAK